MMSRIAKPSDTWVPQYFLSSVGAGGLAVSFFMWLYMWIPHPGQQVPVFEDIAAAWVGGSLLTQAMIAIAIAAIVVFSFLNLKLLVWNLGQHAAFNRSDRMDKLCKTNGESQLLALPLAIAMSINVGFILGLVFVPGLWSIVEYLFPAALIAFLLTGFLALAQLGRFYGRVFGNGGLDWGSNNSFAQVLPAFAFGMVGVGLSAAAALSANPVTAGTAIVLATIFLMLSLLVAVAAMILGLVSMAQHGVNAEAAPTVTIIVPLVTVLGILVLRVNHGIGVHFGAHLADGDYLYILSTFIGVQVAFLLFGAAVLKAQGYFRRFVTGPDASAASYALVCPGVAFAVMLQFFINKGLVGAGLIVKFGAAYWMLSGLAVVAQLATVVLVLLLNRKHVSAPRLPAVTAE
jgi:hypothetical protein